VCDVGGGGRIICRAGAEIGLGSLGKFFGIVPLKRGDHQRIAVESFPTANFAFVEDWLLDAINRPSSGFGLKRVGSFPLGVFESATIDGISEPLVVIGAGDTGRFSSTNDGSYLAECGEECALIEGEVGELFSPGVTDSLSIILAFVCWVAREPQGHGNALGREHP
jgi:hypothetical protein